LKGNTQPRSFLGLIIEKLFLIFYYTSGLFFLNLILSFLGFTFKLSFSFLWNKIKRIDITNNIFIEYIIILYRMVFSNRNFNDNIQSSDKSLDDLFLRFSVRITKIILLIIFNLILFYYEILIPTIIYVTLVNKSYKFSIKVDSKNHDSMIEKNFHEKLEYEIEEDFLILRKW
jgi:hypothetical protein